MSKHTEGPWEADDSVTTWHGGIPALAIFKISSNGRGTPVAWVHPYNYKTEFTGSVEADAKLIAAAPDLYDALRALYQDAIDRSTEVPSEIFDAACKALAKVGA